MARVVFLGADRFREIEPGTTLLAAIRRAGLPIGRSCDGAGICRACVIHVPEGAGLLTPSTALERAAGATHETRLACQARVACQPPIVEAMDPTALQALHAIPAIHGSPRTPSHGGKTDDEDPEALGSPSGTADSSPMASRPQGASTPDEHSPLERSTPQTIRIWSPSFGPLPDP